MSSPSLFTSFFFLLFLSFFLSFIELTSSPSLKAYLKAYVKRFSGLSITTKDWLEHFWLYWSQFPEQLKDLKTVDFNAWLYGEGLTLPVEMDFDTTLADASYALAKSWNDSRSTTSSTTTTGRIFSIEDISNFNSKQVGLFLSTLTSDYPPFEKSLVDHLNEVYKLQASGNSEIRLRFYKFALKSGTFAEEASEWVKTAGRSVSLSLSLFPSVSNTDILFFSLIGFG